MRQPRTEEDAKNQNEKLWALLLPSLRLQS